MKVLLVLVVLISNTISVCDYLAYSCKCWGDFCLAPDFRSLTKLLFRSRLLLRLVLLLRYYCYCYCYYRYYYSGTIILVLLLLLLLLLVLLLKLLLILLNVINDKLLAVKDLAPRGFLPLVPSGSFVSSSELLLPSNETQLIARSLLIDAYLSPWIIYLFWVRMLLLRTLCIFRFRKYAILREVETMHGTLGRFRTRPRRPVRYCLEGYI